MAARALVTCDENAMQLVLEELRRLGGALLPGEWLDTGDTVQGGILLVDLVSDFTSFSKRVEPSCFIWHIAPVQIEIDLTGTMDDLGLLEAQVAALAAIVDPARTFSVQTRILGTGKLPYRKVTINETLSKSLEAQLSATMDCRWPEQVVSVLCTPTKAYLGVSPVHENRSIWAGGQHRLKASNHQISRSEFKLEEAMSVFQLEVPRDSKALDIGAAPGGWSRILAEHGLEVEAVDPADLDPRLRSTSVVHIRKRIQEYQVGRRQFVFIANDMKMDPRQSIEIMLRLAPNLSDCGFGIVTLKMPKLDDTSAEARKTLDMLRMDLEQLSAGYEVLGVRQLYHNRSEVTVAVGKKR